MIFENAWEPCVRQSAKKIASFVVVRVFVFYFVPVTIKRFQTVWLRCRAYEACHAPLS